MCLKCAIRTSTQQSHSRSLARSLCGVKQKKDHHNTSSNHRRNLPFIISWHATHGKGVCFVDSYTADARVPMSSHAIRYSEHWRSKTATTVQQMQENSTDPKLAGRGLPNPPNPTCVWLVLRRRFVLRSEQRILSFICLTKHPLTRNEGIAMKCSLRLNSKRYVQINITQHGFISW